MSCKKCGAKGQEGKFCRKCGAKLMGITGGKERSQEPSKKGSSSEGGVNIPKLKERAKQAMKDQDYDMALKILLKITEETTDGTKLTNVSIGQLTQLAADLRSSVAGFKV